ncbi:MAG: 4-coumarate--CoA ligase family protein [Acidimicrobiia bacterium]|nr:4-coumarate--CoA ligase family protein [Acidimicrobiia bacterium]
MIHTSPYPGVSIPDVSITTYVLKEASANPDKPALIDGPTGRQLTFGQLEAGIRALAGGLRSRGFGRGDVLAILAPNLPEYAIVFHGAAMAGGTITTLNPTYTAEEVRFQLEDSGASYLVTVGIIVDVAREAAARAGLENVYTIDPTEGAAPLSELFGAPLGEHTPVNPSEDVVVLPYSSGTTGLPKGVMLTHRNLVANLEQSQVVLEISPDDIGIGILPFFHIYGMQVLMNGALAQGTTLVTMPRFDLAQFLQICQDHAVTRYYLVPPIVLALAKHPLVDEYDLSAARQVFSGAAPLGAELAAQAAARVGCEVVQGYGLTETSPVTHATPVGGFKAGSIGVLLPNTECRIVDPVSGADLGLDDDGEIWIRGDQVMKGYLNNPEATAVTIDEHGWLHTGDIGHVDEDGHYFIVDRLKELIKYKGFQVAPAELEALLLTHPAVADVAVVPIPDVEAGELPKAFVVTKPDAAVAAADLQEYVAGHVAHYKQIRALEFVDEIPKSASGKILRRVLRDRG